MSTTRLQPNLLYTAHSFVERQKAPEYIYSGEYRPPSLVMNRPEGIFAIDLNLDAWEDFVIPITRAYSTGLDTRVPFIALNNSNGVLVFSNSFNERMPVTSGVTCV